MCLKNGWRSKTTEMLEEKSPDNRASWGGRRWPERRRTAEGHVWMSSGHQSCTEGEIRGGVRVPGRPQGGGFMPNPKNSCVERGEAGGFLGDWCFLIAHRILRPLQRQQLFILPYLFLVAVTWALIALYEVAWLTHTWRHGKLPTNTVEEYLRQSEQLSALFKGFL